MDSLGAAVTVRGLSHGYDVGDGTLEVLHDVDLAVPAGGYCAVQGSSGAGKTTLLSLIGGLERARSGSIVVGDTDVATLRGDDLAAFRGRTVGFVFQDFGLIGTLSAQENVELASLLAGAARRDRSRRAVELLEEVGLADRRRHRPAQLSGGERQRVAIARALANQPRVILADEPTGNLDAGSGALVFDALEDLHRRRGCTLLVVTHDDALAARAGQRVHIEDGRVVERSDAA